MADALRPLRDHRGDVTNDVLRIYATAPSPGGACQVYLVAVPEGCRDLMLAPPRREVVAGEEELARLLFAPLGGLTNEALLAIVLDRLRGFQQGPYSCRENALALTSAETALLWLRHRHRRVAEEHNRALLDLDVGPIERIVEPGD